MRKRPGSPAASDLLQHILAGAHADLLGLLQRGLPLDIGVGILEVVVVAVPAGLCKVLAQLAVRQRLCIQAGIGAGLIQRHRIKGCKDADIRQDGCIVLAVAVAVGADVLHQRNVEAGTACAYGSRVLGHFAVQHLIGAVALGIDGVKVTGTDAAAAALALGLVNDGLVVCIVGNGIGAALLGAAVAAAAQALLHLRVSGGVLYHLARAGAAAHADILERTAETGGLNNI